MNVREVVGTCLISLAVAAAPALSQEIWTSESNGTVAATTHQRITFGTSGASSKILTHTDAANLEILNRGTGATTIHFGPALALRNGEGGGAYAMYLNASGVGVGITNPQADLHVNGTTRTDVLEITGGSDVAELFDVRGGAEPGTVVAIDTERPGALRVSSAAYDRTVLGVVSGAGGVSSGLLLGQPGTLAHGSHAVAVSGRVHVKADTSNGPIAPGDLLTTSSRPGHVMKATDGARMVGAIVGKALSPLADDTGLVLAVVALQ